MGLIGSLADAVLFIFYLTMAVAVPFMDAHICFDSKYIPTCFTDLSTWYVKHYGDYLMADKPHFFVGLVWLELLFQWPLALVNIFALLAGHPCFSTTSLIYGVSLSTSLVNLRSGCNLNLEMEFLRMVVETILFLGFLVIAVFAPTLDAQTCLPSNVFPDVLVDLKKWYAAEYGDYLTAEKPSFFVGLVWVELVFQWPLALVNLYGIVARKSWFSTTCLMYGASVLTSMVAIIADLLGSGRASDKLLSLYYPFLGLAVLSILRGLVPSSRKPTSSPGRRPLPRKKRD